MKERKNIGMREAWKLITANVYDGKYVRPYGVCWANGRLLSSMSVGRFISKGCLIKTFERGKYELTGKQPNYSRKKRGGENMASAKISMSKLWSGIVAAKKDLSNCLNVNAMCQANFQRKAPPAKHIKSLLRWGSLAKTDDPLVFKVTDKKPPLRHRDPKSGATTKKIKMVYIGHKAPSRDAFFRALVAEQDKDGWAHTKRTWKKHFPEKGYSSNLPKALHQEGKVSDRKRGWVRLAEKYRNTFPAPKPVAKLIPKPAPIKKPVPAAKSVSVAPPADFLISALQLVNAKMRQVEVGCDKKLVWRVGNLEGILSGEFPYKTDEEIDEAINELQKMNVLSQSEPNGHTVKIYNVDTKLLANSLAGHDPLPPPKPKAEKMIQQWEEEISQKERAIVERNEQNAKDATRIKQLKELTEMFANSSDPEFAIT